MLSILSVSQMSRIDYESFSMGGSFNDHRCLEEYLKNCDESFTEEIQNLRKDQLWVDIGCGRAVALQDYVKSFPEGGNVIGITVQRPFCNKSFGYRLEREFINADREIPRLHLYLANFLTLPIDSLHARVSLITDIYAVFQYSGELDSALEKMYNILEEGGKAFIAYTNDYFQKVTVTNLENNVISILSNLDEIKNIIFAWLKTVEGLETIQYRSKERHTEIVLQRTTKPFKADCFRIEKYYEIGETRSVVQRISDCIRLKSLQPLKNRNLWMPSTSQMAYKYSFIWNQSNTVISSTNYETDSDDDDISDSDFYDAESFDFESGITHV